MGKQAQRCPAPTEERTPSSRQVRTRTQLSDSVQHACLSTTHLTPAPGLCRDKGALPPPPFSPHHAPPSSYQARYRRAPSHVGKETKKLSRPPNQDRLHKAQGKMKTWAPCSKVFRISRWQQQTIKSPSKMGPGGTVWVTSMMPILPRTHTIPKTNSSLTWEISQVRRCGAPGPHGYWSWEANAALAQRPHPLPQVLRTPTLSSSRSHLQVTRALPTCGL